MQFSEIFQFQFKDPDWIKKLLLAGLISLIPVVGGFFLMGWTLQITKKVINHEPVTLPEINFGEYMGVGFKAIVIALVYSLPVIIVSIPMALVGPIGAAVGMDENTLGILMTVVSLCCGGLELIFGLAAGFLLPAALASFVVNGTISSGLKFADVFALVKKAPVAYLLVLVGMLVANFVSSLGLIACGIGVLFTMPYAMTMMAHLYGQAYLQATEPK
jgi:hypothetical protein